ncbi:MAG: transcriptional repressor [Bacteroidetes bacterium]|nr:transcriptional repressor [Bacteroidota bacterium]
MEAHTDIEKLLEAHKLSNTSCRRSALDLFIKTPYALSHQEVEKALNQEFDRVTLYRTFNSFEEKGLIHKVIDGEGITKYAFCHHDCSTASHNDSHLHFSCSKCNKTTCIDQVAIPEFKLPEGFLLEKISLNAEGICGKCR